MTKLELVGFCDNCRNCENSRPNIYRACTTVSEEPPRVWNQGTVDNFNFLLEQE